MRSFEEARLWQESLGQQSDGEQGRLLEELRVQLRGFRQNAGFLAEEIARDLPYFTVHDLRHIDALWEIAGEIAGNEVALNPAEAFVLGGAFLVHDLGMASAAYPDGPAGVEALPAWNMALTAVLRRNLGRHPSEQDLAAAGEDDRREAMEAVLRRRHAQQAEELAVKPLVRQGQESRFLIEDAEWRNAFGRLIGRIAYSHWWPVDQIRKEFPRIINAPAGMPREWTIDPLKLACMLRTADAAHLDKLRAPSLLRLLRDPPGISHEHWVFQGALDPPRLDGDHLHFTSTRAFPPEDAEAWWLCLDALRVADWELRETDALLADLHRPRFAARGVAGVDSPERLAELIPTDDWIPREAKIDVSDVGRIIENLGGEKLYGNQLAVPLRELIQNATDAVNLRFHQDGTRDPIIVGFQPDGEHGVLEVVDCGTGMSPDVLTGALLDFGVSLWSSDSFVDEFPDGMDGFEPIGSFGIGFFSVFMWAERVEVVSRRFDAALADTYVLEISHGSAGRPLLRRARAEERRLKPGTTVRLELKKSLAELSGAFGEGLQRLCGRVAPASSVTIRTREGSDAADIAVSADDWVSMPGIELLKRTQGNPGGWRKGSVAEEVAENLRTVAGPNGEVAGRLALVPPSGAGLYQAGVFTVGGLRSDGLEHFAGVLEGIEPTASRNEAQMNIRHEDLAEWATEQAKLVSPLLTDHLDGIVVASRVAQLGGDPGDLPLCETADGFLSRERLQDWVREREDLLLLDLSEPDSDFYAFVGLEEPFEPADNVVVMRAGGRGIARFLRPPGIYAEADTVVRSVDLETLITEAIASSWGFHPRAEIYPDEEEMEEFWEKGPVSVGRVGSRTITVSWVTPLGPEYATKAGW